MITHATYIGPPCGWNVVPGMGALLQPGTTTGTVLAQFDAHHAQRNGKDLSVGWHEFPAEHFKPDTAEAATP